VPGKPDWDGSPPAEGDLEAATLAALLDVLAAAGGDPLCFHAVWDGWGWLNPGGMSMLHATAHPGRPPAVPGSPLGVSHDVGNAPRLRLPGRDYLLFRGPLRSAQNIGIDLTGSLFCAVTDSAVACRPSLVRRQRDRLRFHGGRWI